MTFEEKLASIDKSEYKRVNDWVPFITSITQGSIRNVIFNDTIQIEDVFFNNSIRFKNCFFVMVSTLAILQNLQHFLIVT
jgi:hypothetical protein